MELSDLEQSFRGFALTGFWDVPASVTGEYGYAELWNASGSGVILVVTSIVVKAENSGFHRFGRITTLTATGFGNSVNKRLGYGATLRMYQSRSTTPPGMTTMGLLPNYDIMSYKLDHPIIIYPSNGLHFRCGVSNTRWMGTVEYLEIPA